MRSALQKLLNISSSASSLEEPSLDNHLFDDLKMAGSFVRSLLQKKNGFYAFESALHVFPAQTIGNEIGIVEWNYPDLWRHEYKNMTDGCIFFAEDIFGGQFLIKNDAICSFDPETGEITYLADDLEGWAKTILDDYDVITGYSLAKAWQCKEGMLQRGVRLLPKKPFVLGGNFDIDNLYPIVAVKGMQLRGNLAVQIRDIPDGSKISWHFIE